jgi:hypothetical protein
LLLVSVSLWHFYFAICLLLLSHPRQKTDFV